MNGDSRYGILYCAPADIAELSRVANCKDIHITNVTPVGIQPFQRCERQSAYLIETAQTYDMLKDRSFTKVKFKLNQEICEWIYHEMKKGDLVYPNEGKGSCHDIADAVSNSKVHTKEAFDCAIDSLGINESRKSELIDKLNSKGYTLQDKFEWCTPERQKELERDCFESTKDIESSFRLMFCI